MAIKRTRKLPMASGPSYDLSIDSFDWKRIEAAYGEKLSIPARLRLVEATQVHILQTGFEYNAQPVQFATDRIEKLKEAANSFRAVMFSGGENCRDSRTYADHEIKRNFDDPRLAAPELFHGLGGLLTSFIVACNVALANMTPEKLAHGPRDGTGWNIWVFRLTLAAREFGLPEGARNDSDKSATDLPSPFVRLVKELQAQLPEQFRQKRASDHALAKAIHRGRTPYDRDMKNAAQKENKSRPTRTDAC